MQAIVHYFQYTDDMETYHNLSKPILHRALLLCSLSLLATFLLNNYKQALGILENSPKILARIMIDMGISSVDVFDNWLDEEKEYLLGLKTEPEAETLQMEYYQKLINFCTSK